MADKLRYLFIEDKPEERDSKRISSFLNNDEAICEMVKPPEFEMLVELQYDAFITDYELAAAHIPFTGRTFATELRVHHPDTPIILLTRRSLFANENHPNYPQSYNSDFDLVMYKDDFQKDAEQHLLQIASLVRGFQQLQSLNNTGDDWEVIGNLMGLQDDDEIIALNEANPPNKRGYWLVTETAEWVRNVIIKYPGILFDDLHAATSLGITVDEFNQNDKLQELFQPALYTGVFFEFGRRWWAKRLLQIGTKLLIQAGLDTFLSAGFAKAFEQLNGVQLDLATCVSDKTPIADAVCYVLEKPVKYENSLPYFPDHRPSVMQQARVSREAVTTSSKVKPILFSPIHIEQVKKWQEGS